MAGLQIETRLRPCYARINKGDRKRKALFHSWGFVSNVIDPSPMITGHPGGVVAHTMGIVELEDGRIFEVMPENIQFVEGIFKDYQWDDNKGE